MKTVQNKTSRPIKLALHGGRALHLGLHKSGQISDKDADRPVVRRLIEQRDVEILEDAAADEIASGPRGKSVPNSGRSQRKVVLPGGGRTSSGREKR